MTAATCAEALRSALRAPCDANRMHDSFADVVMDFENAQPTEAELEVYDVALSVMEHSGRLLNDVENYGPGATAAIRNVRFAFFNLAINIPDNAELQRTCWLDVLAHVKRLKLYYDFSLRLEQVVPMLLWELCSGPLPSLDQLEQHQALTKQFAQILQFTLQFDERKMCTPAIQNDFSYYRRTMSRNQLAYGVASPKGEVFIAVDLANMMSFFFADPTPMLSTLKRATDSFVRRHPALPVENTTDMLCTMSRICRSMLENPTLSERFLRAETRLFCLRVMTAAVVLYDHVHPTGAFVRSCDIDIRRVIRLLQSFEPDSENLLNALRWTSRTANNTNTPKSIKIMLGLIHHH